MRTRMILIPDGEAQTSGGTSMVRLEHFAAAYYVFHDKGIEAVLASPAGGSPWLRPAQPRPGKQGRSGAALAGKDGQARDALTDTIRLDQAYAEDFEGALCLGAPGPIWRRQSGQPGCGSDRRLSRRGQTRRHHAERSRPRCRTAPAGDC